MIAAPVQGDVDGIPKGSHYVRVTIAIGRPNAHLKSRGSRCFEWEVGVKEVTTRGSGAGRRLEVQRLLPPALRAAPLPASPQSDKGGGCILSAASASRALTRDALLCATRARCGSGYFQPVVLTSTETSRHPAWGVSVRGTVCLARSSPQNGQPVGIGSSHGRIMK